MSKKLEDSSDLKAIGKKRDVKRKTLPALAMAGPVSLWMILFVTIPMLFIIYISFMSRGVFGDVVYQFSGESYQTLMDATYFKVILKSLRVAVFTTVLCLLVGYPFAYYIARKPKETAAKLIMLIMIPFWTNSLMRLNSWLLAAGVPDQRPGQQLFAVGWIDRCARYLCLYGRTGGFGYDHQYASLCGAADVQLD